MINKFKDWDTTPAEETSSKSLPVGNYVVRVQNVYDVPEKEYIRVEFDIVEGKFEGYFSNLFKNLGVWSNQGVKYASYKETATKFFRQFVTALEKSNKGYVWDWDESKWKGKLFVAVYGEEEYIDKNGDVKTSVKLRECRSIEALKNGEIKTPQLKKLATKPQAPVTDYTVNNDDLPF